MSILSILQVYLQIKWSEFFFYLKFFFRCFILGWMIGSFNTSNVTIHGHFPITMKEFNHKLCSHINKKVGVEFVEAMLFAVDQVNKEKNNLLYGLTLGVNILDTCSNSKLNIFSALMQHSMAVVGPYSLQLSQFTARFLDVFKIAQISYGATSENLALRNGGFPVHFSTSPTDQYTSQVYVELAKRFQWEYTAAFFSETEGGNSLFKVVASRLRANHLCVAVQKSINNAASLEEYTDAMQLFLNNQRLKVAFIFLSFKGCRDFFTAADHLEEVEKLLLSTKQLVVGSSCGTMTDIPLGLQKYLEGTITIQISDSSPEQFKEYFQGLTMEGNIRDFYYKEYLEKTHNICEEKSTSRRSYPNTPKKPCSMAENTIQYDDHTPVRPVIDAVYMVVHAVRNAIANICRDRIDVDVKECYRDNKSRIQRSLYKYLRDTHFWNVYNNETFQFTKETKSVTSNFDIFQYQRVGLDGKHTFIKIGKWTYSETSSPTLYINGSRTSVNITSSKCSEPCRRKEMQVKNGHPDCRCWRCFPCPQDQILTNNTCSSCKLGFKPNWEHTGCEALEVSQMSPERLTSIVVISISGFGLLVVLSIFTIYTKYSSSHIIKSTSYELALISLMGLSLMLTTPVLLVLVPSKLVCYAQKILIGLSLTCCYAPLVLKTNRIYRIFASSSKFKRILTVTIQSQITMVMTMVGIELVIGIFWILTEKPAVAVLYPTNSSDHTNNHVIRRCSTSGIGSVLNLVFPAGLMVATTYWAFKTRKLPEVFSQSKSIGVTMYITLFLSIGALALVSILEGLNLKFAGTYVMCFVFQAITFVTLFGQYAMRIRKLYLNLQATSENEQSVKNALSGLTFSNHFSLLSFSNQSRPQTNSKSDSRQVLSVPTQVINMNLSNSSIASSTATDNPLNDI